MALVLNIETSSHNCSVSISSCGKIISTEEKIFEEYSHSKFLHVHIERLFKKINLKPSELSAVSVSQGPGSYTGLRIGISAAKGFCFALNIPMISLDTMRILAESVSDKNCYIISAMDARRDEIYFSVFKASKKETIRIRQTDIMILNSTSFSDFLNNKFFLLSNHPFILLLHYHHLNIWLFYLIKNILTVILLIFLTFLQIISKIFLEKRFKI